MAYHGLIQPASRLLPGKIVALFHNSHFSLLFEATPSGNLQLKIGSSGDGTLFSTLSTSPIFTATYTSLASGQSVPGDASKLNVGITIANDAQQSSSHRKTAALILIPLLSIGFLPAYFKWKCGQGLDKRKKWTETG